MTDLVSRSRSQMSRIAKTHSKLWRIKLFKLALKVPIIRQKDLHKSYIFRNYWSHSFYKQMFHQLRVTKTLVIWRWFILGNNLKDGTEIWQKYIVDNLGNYVTWISPLRSRWDVKGVPESKHVIRHPSPTEK